MRLQGPGRRAALTVVELVLAVLLFTLLAAVLFDLVRFHRLSWFTVERLDVLQRMRAAVARLQAEVGLGTAVLYPVAQAAVAHQLVFAGPRNELKVLWLEPTGELKLLEREHDPEVLCDDVLSLDVVQPVRGLVRVEVRCRAPDRASLSFLVTGRVGNSFLGEGRTP